VRVTPTLYIIGGGLFGSQAAAFARSRGIEAVVFDVGLPGAASPAAAGLFKEAWAGKKLAKHFHDALPVLDQLYGIRRVTLHHDDGTPDEFHFVPPTAILEREPVRERVTAVGDGWLEAGGHRYDGYIYIAAGVWCEEFRPGLGVYGKAGAAYVFSGERPGRIRPLTRSQQAIAFVRDSGTTHFSDGTAERHYTEEHNRQSLARAAEMGLVDPPVERIWGLRPYTSGGPTFLRLGERTWLATGGRKMGTIIGAAFAQRLVLQNLAGCA
jgi:glycine/D-amino acid oxidase-like deaminating enzyme